jgi:hypothetical protein
MITSFQGSIVICVIIVCFRLLFQVLSILLILFYFWYALLIKDVAETVQRSPYIVFLYYCSSGLHAQKAIA